MSTVTPGTLKSSFRDKFPTWSLEGSSHTTTLRLGYLSYCRLSHPLLGSHQLEISLTPSAMVGPTSGRAHLDPVLIEPLGVPSLEWRLHFPCVRPRHLGKKHRLSPTIPLTALMPHWTCWKAWMSWGSMKTSYVSICIAWPLPNSDPLRLKIYPVM